LATIQSRQQRSHLGAGNNAANVIDSCEKAVLSGTTLMRRRCS